MTKKEILKGIKNYSEEQKIIITTIKKHNNNLHQDVFDSRFSEFGSNQFGVSYLEKDSFILGGVNSSNYSKWLELTQLMIQAKILTTKGRVPNIYYMVKREV